MLLVDPSPSWLSRAGSVKAGLAPLSRVVTPGGFCAAQDLQIGDLVMTGRDGPKPVTAVAQGVAPSGVVHVVTRGVCRPLTLAPQQAIWAIKGESKRCAAMGVKWDALIGRGDRPQAIPADFISPGDYVHIPAQPGDAEPISADLAWAYGLYLAEGSALVAGGASKKHYRVQMTMHEREFAVLQKFADILSEELGMAAPRVHLRKRVNFTSEYVHSGKDFALHFRELFGHGAAGKRLPSWMNQMSPTLKRAVVQGWVDGDGHSATKADGYVVTSASTISAHMAVQLYQLSVSAGQAPAMAELKAGGRRKHDAFTIHFNAGQESVHVDGMLFHRVNARYRAADAVPLVGVEVAGASSLVVENVEVLF